MFNMLRPLLEMLGPPTPIVGVELIPLAQPPMPWICFDSRFLSQTHEVLFPPARRNETKRRPHEILEMVKTNTEGGQVDQV